MGVLTWFPLYPSASLVDGHTDVQFRSLLPAPSVQDWVTVWDTMVEAIHLIVNCCRLTLFEGIICSSALKTTFHFTLYPLIAHMMAPINLYVQSFALNIELGFSSGWSCRLDWDALGGKGGWVAGCPHHHCANHWKGRMGAAAQPRDPNSPAPAPCRPPNIRIGRFPDESW